MKCGVDFRDAIPADLWQTRPGPLADFLKEEWADWQKETAEKISDLRELETWLTSLNAPPRSPDLD
jgi:hypothetical protein